MIVRRREFTTLLGGAMIAWPFAARSQQPERMRRVGVLSALTADDPEGQTRVAAFREALQKLGWTDGRNLQLDIRWSEAMPNACARMRRTLPRLRRT
jgi:putative ABC transport system substrate-binding protein